MHHGSIDNEHLRISVLSTRKGESQYADRDEIEIQLWSSNLSASFQLSPTEARDLAERLAGAVVAVQAPEPEVIDFSLYREPEAA